MCVRPCDSLPELLVYKGIFSFCPNLSLHQRSNQRQRGDHAEQLVHIWGIIQCFCLCCYFSSLTCFPHTGRFGFPPSEWFPCLAVCLCLSKSSVICLLSLRDSYTLNSFCNLKSVPFCNLFFIFHCSSFSLQEFQSRNLFSQHTAYRISSNQLRGDTDLIPVCIQTSCICSY